MERAAAARLLGVPPGASSRRVEKAFRARVLAGHPDRFPPGSEAWEDANHALALLLEARSALGVEPAVRPVAPGTAAAHDVPVPRDRSSEGFRSARDTDRLARAWGYGWGGFLLGSAVLGVAVGATGGGNDALPLWSPALALIGAVSVTIGWRADRRLRRRA